MYGAALHICGAACNAAPQRCNAAPQISCVLAFNALVRRALCFGRRPFSFFFFGAVFLKAMGTFPGKGNKEPRTAKQLKGNNGDRFP